MSASPTPSLFARQPDASFVTAGTGILWAIEGHRNVHNPTNCDPGQGSDEGGTLHAYDATTLQELYNSANSLTSELPNAHFNVPMVFQGRVYMGAAGSDQVYVFGLCSEGAGGCVQPH